MAKVTFDNEGNMLNEDGKVVNRGQFQNVQITSEDATPVTLDETGVKLPPAKIPPQILEARRKWNEEHGKTENVGEEQPRVEETKKPVAEPMEEIVGVSSFRREKTKYEVNSQSYFVIKFGLVQKEDGRFVPIREDAIAGIPEAEAHWVKFRMWTYTEELNWKDKCTEYDAKARAQVINTTKLNEMKIRRLMLDWSFGEYNDSLRLLHCDGKLSDESYNVFRGMYPSIANTIVDMMNLVLESNQ